MSELIVTHVFEIIVIITNSMIGYLIWYMQKRFGDKSAHKRAITVMLRHELKDIYNHCKKDGHVTQDDLEEFEDIYNIYHDLGGNGIATKWHNNMLEMEVK